MKKFLLILLLKFIVFPIQLIIAQSNSEIMLTTGVIYTNTDTIKCFIRIDDNLQLFVKYKTDKNDDKFQKMRMDEINMLKRGVSTYKNIEYKGEKTLFEVKVEGKVSLFERSVSGYASAGMAPGSNTNTPPLMLKESRIYYISNGVEIYKLNRMNYKDDIKRMLVGGESFYEAVEKLKYDGIWIDLTRIISNYNFMKRNNQ